MNDAERDSLLIRLDERMSHLERAFSNHLRHHWAITITLAACLLGVVAKVVLSAVFRATP